MDTTKEMSGAGPLRNRQIYVSPEAETADVEMCDLIAISADNVDVCDPWGDSTETEW